MACLCLLFLFFLSFFALRGFSSGAGDSSSSSNPPQPTRRRSADAAPAVLRTCRSSSTRLMVMCTGVHPPSMAAQPQYPAGRPVAEFQCHSCHVQRVVGIDDGSPASPARQSKNGAGSSSHSAVSSSTGSTRARCTPGGPARRGSAVPDGRAATSDPSRSLRQFIARQISRSAAVVLRLLAAHGRRSRW